MCKQASEVERSRQGVLTSQTCPVFSTAHTHLKAFVLQVHFQQRVSHQVPEAAAVEVTVRLGVTPAVVDLWELQPTHLQEVVAMEVLGLTEHLCTKSHVVFSMTGL